MLRQTGDTKMRNIDEAIAISADVEAESRIIAMMNDQPFAEGKPDRFHIMAKVIAKMWTEEASERFGSVHAIEQAIIEKENEMFSSAFK